MDDPSQLPKIAEWSVSVGSEPDYVRYVGNVIGSQGFYASARVLWPHFKTRHGCVFIDWKYEEENVDMWHKTLAGQQTEIEKVVNHVHVWDLFDDNKDSRLLIDIAQMMRLCWLCSAKHSLPDRKVEVDLMVDESEYGPTLTLFTRRTA